MTNYEEKDPLLRQAGPVSLLSILPVCGPERVTKRSSKKKKGRERKKKQLGHRKRSQGKLLKKESSRAGREDESIEGKRAVRKILSRTS